MTLPNPTDVTKEISTAAQQLFDQRVTLRMPIRLLGVGSSGIGEHAVRQKSLFDEPERDQQQQLDAASDLIREKVWSRRAFAGVTNDAQHQTSGTTQTQE